ncbi:MAG: WYL domain-containing protein [Chloroflexota bacterium]
MEYAPLTLPALYIIFTLLNAVRRGIPRPNLWREFRRQNLALKPRLSFWLAICKQAGLVDEYENRLRVKGYARQWLNKSEDEQTISLIEAWGSAPRNYKARQHRRKLLWKLRFDKPLTQKDRLALNGLHALGLLDGEKLTAWGRFFIKGEGALPTPQMPKPCQLNGDRFIASFPQHVDLLWDLEKILRPCAPGVYPLPSLRASAGRVAPCSSGHIETKRAKQSPTLLTGDPHKLIDLLERGLQSELPKPMRARLLGQPSLQIRQALFIEFSDPGELKQLRRQPNLRKHIERYLSPRHVLISPKDQNRLLKMFERRGIYITFHEESSEAAGKRTHFQRQTPLQPVGKDIPKLDALNQYLRLQQALDILYRAPGFPAEQRRITPLTIERRGEHTYVIAYCHARRAQRTFRLDRMEIPGTY